MLAAGRGGAWVPGEGLLLAREVVGGRMLFIGVLEEETGAMLFTLGLPLMFLLLLLVMELALLLLLLMGVVVLLLVILMAGDVRPTPPLPPSRAEG